MPTCDYGGEACGAQWGLAQRISEAPIKKCPECGKRKARRLISGGNFILKGSGWYADLYHKPKGGGASKKAEGKSDGGGSADSGSSGSTDGSSPKQAASE